MQVGKRAQGVKSGNYKVWVVRHGHTSRRSPNRQEKAIETKTRRAGKNACRQARLDSPRCHPRRIAMLNQEGFVLLGGDPSKWDKEMLKRSKNGDALTDIQKDQFCAGRESAELVKGGSGWYVRSSTSLDENKILLHGQFTKEFAVEWGKKWADQDPKNREFFARRSSLTKGEVRDWSV